MNEMKKEAARSDTRKLSRAKSGRSFFFGLLRRERDAETGKWSIRFNIGRCAAALLTLCIMGWFGLSFCIWLAYKYVADYKDISFLQVAASPFNTTKHRRLMGEFNIREAERLFSEGNYSSAIINLQKGVARSPDNLSARINLALIYMAAFGKPDDAARILDEKVKLAFDAKNKAYLMMSISVFAAGDEYLKKSAVLASACESSGILSPDEIIKSLQSVVKRMRLQKLYASLAAYCSELAENLSDAKTRNFIGACGADAYLSLMDFDSAEAMIKKCGVTSRDVILSFECRKKMASGDEIGALKTAMKALKTTRNPTRLYNFISQCHSDFGFQDEFNKARKLADMTSGKPYAADLAKIKEANPSEAGQMCESYLKKYSSGQSVLLLMSYALSSRDEKLIKKCSDILSGGNYGDKVAAGMMMAEYFVRQRKPQDALFEINTVKKLAFSQKKQNALFPGEGIEIAISALSGEKVDDRIRKFIDARIENPFEVYAFSDFLCDANLDREAQIALEYSAEKFPQDWRFPSLSFQLCAKRGDIGELVSEVGKSKVRVPIKILLSLPENLDGDAYVFIGESLREAAASKAAEARRKLAEYKELVGVD